MEGRIRCGFLSTGVVAGGGDGVIGSDSSETSTGGMSRNSSYHTVYIVCYVAYYGVENYSGL